MKNLEYNTGHPHATPNFRNLVIRPMWITMKTALRTIPYIGKAKFLKNDYHAQEATMVDEFTINRVGENHPSVGQVILQHLSSKVIFLSKIMEVLHRLGANLKTMIFPMKMAFT